MVANGITFLEGDLSLTPSVVVVLAHILSEREKLGGGTARLSGFILVVFRKRFEIIRIPAHATTIVLDPVISLDAWASIAVLLAEHGLADGAKEVLGILTKRFDYRREDTKAAMKARKSCFAGLLVLEGNQFMYRRSLGGRKTENRFVLCWLFFLPPFSRSFPARLIRSVRLRRDLVFSPRWGISLETFGLTIRAL